MRRQVRGTRFSIEWDSSHRRCYRLATCASNLFSEVGSMARRAQPAVSGTSSASTARRVKLWSRWGSVHPELRPTRPVERRHHFADGHCPRPQPAAALAWHVHRSESAKFLCRLFARRADRDRDLPSAAIGSNSLAPNGRRRRAADRHHVRGISSGIVVRLPRGGHRRIRVDPLALTASNSKVSTVHKQQRSDIVPESPADAARQARRPPQGQNTRRTRERRSPSEVLQPGPLPGPPMVQNKVTALPPAARKRSRRPP